jgi:MFS transporter, ACS family, hexuronate transporter
MRIAGRTITIPKLRWVIAALLLLATMLNYIDRLTISVVITDLRKQFSLTEQDYSQIISLFLMAYAIMYAGSGYIVDRLGTRKGFSVFIFAWSVAQMLHGLAHGKWSLAGCRLLLGLTEPGNFPAAVKAVGEWFPVSERAIGVGIFNAGSSLGSAAAVPITVFLTVHYGWRSAFVATGVLGLIWLGFWLVLYRAPAHNRWLPAEERRELELKMGVIEQPKRGPMETPWYELLRKRQCYTLILVRLLTDAPLFFIIFWLPEYLRKARGFNLQEVGTYSWVPFVFGDVGYVFGGWLSGHLIRRGWMLSQARKLVMLVGAALLPSAIAAPFMPSAGAAIGAICLVLLGHAIWIANLMTLPADLFPSYQIGAVTGLSGMGGAVGGIISNLFAGYTVAKFSYTPTFIAAGLMHPLAALLLYLFLPDKYFPHSSGVRPE